MFVYVRCKSARAREIGVSIESEAEPVHVSYEKADLLALFLIFYNSGNIMILFSPPLDLLSKIQICTLQLGRQKQQ